MHGRNNTGETITGDRVRQHYEIEKILANRLRQADKRERRKLYSSVYEELFKQVPFHPMLVRKADPQATRTAVDPQMCLLRRFLSPAATFLEVGPGDCSLAFAVAQYVGKVYAIDVSREITARLNTPRNFELVLSDGCSIPVPSNSVDVAYSNQVIEHLHPDDAVDHLRMIYNALVPNGIYICITPNRLSGPHDVSGQFDTVPTGLHLKEYTNRELSELFQSVGYFRIRTIPALKGRFASLPPWTVSPWEGALEKLPFPIRRKMAAALPFRALLGVRMSGRKPAQEGMSSQ